MTQPRTVTIVAANRETRDGMRTYLERAGLRARAVAHMDQSVLRDPPRTAVVIFPDELVVETVLAAMALLRKARPRLLSLIVTRDPSRFADMPGRTVVLAKPAWGWSILETIRRLADADP
jgi:hypothetical protein